MSVGPNLSWIKTKVKKLQIQNFLIFLVCLIVSFFLYENIGYSNLINIILISASFYLFIIAVRDFFLKESKFYSQKISHLGFSVLILSILLNNIFSTEVIKNLKVGDKLTFNNGSITFDSITKTESKNDPNIPE